MKYSRHVASAMWERKQGERAEGIPSRYARHRKESSVVSEVLSQSAKVISHNTETDFSVPLRLGFRWVCRNFVEPILSEQGSDLRELRLTWKEMEKLIFSSGSTAGLRIDRAKSEGVAS